MLCNASCLIQYLTLFAFAAQWFRTDIRRTRSLGAGVSIVALLFCDVFFNTLISYFIRLSAVSTQRRHYKILTSGNGEATPMTPARAQKLEEIGFEWATKDPRHVPWEQRYAELCEFREKYGHSQVSLTLRIYNFNC